MARIRSVKPEIWTDEKFVELSAFARLLFIGLLNFADDEGRMVYSPMRIKMQILPADNIDISELLGEIRGNSMVNVYSVDNKEYLHITNFAKHQKVDKRISSKLPPPPKNPELLRLSPPDQGSRIKDQGKDGMETPTPTESKNQESESDSHSSFRKKKSNGHDSPKDLSADADPDTLTTDIEKAVYNWNVTAKELGLPQVKAFTADREKRLRQRLREHGLAGWNQALDQLEHSPFCLGTSESGWKADFDFMLQPKSFNRLLEGSYGGKRDGDIEF